jgi:hypothetical protein
MGKKACQRIKGTSKHSNEHGFKSFSNTRIKVESKEAPGKLVLKIRNLGEKMKKVIKPLGETTNENPKCHLHIPQPKKNILCVEHHHPRHPRKKRM